MSKAPLMPRATAVWLVENTALTFEQIAEFCAMHVLEIQGIADGEVAVGVRGIDPTRNGQLTSDNIAKAEADPSLRLAMVEPKIKLSSDISRKGPRYTPLSRRHDRPNAILWLLRNHGELKDAQISRLVGTTKSTIDAVRNRSHWNYTNLTASDPVVLGLCSQIELDFEVKRAAKSLPQQDETDPLAPPLSEPVPDESMSEVEPSDSDVFATMSRQEDKPADDVYDAESVFAKLKELKS